MVYSIFIIHSFLFCLNSIFSNYFSKFINKDNNFLLLLGCLKLKFILFPLIYYSYFFLSIPLFLNTIESNIAILILYFLILIPSILWQINTIVCKEKNIDRLKNIFIFKKTISGVLLPLINYLLILIVLFMITALLFRFNFPV